MIAAALLAVAFAAQDDPVQLTVTASAGTITVALAAEAGALDPRAGAIHVHVRLARGLCGGSFVGTPGITAIDATPAPQPTAGAAYATQAQGTPAVPAGTYTVCAFLDDDEGRQWATDVDTELSVGAGGTQTPTGAPPGCVRLKTLPRRVTRGSLIASARVARKHGHSTLLVRVRTPARLSLRFQHRVQVRHPRPCRTLAVRLPARHGTVRVAASIRRGSEIRSIKF